MNRPLLPRVRAMMVLVVALLVHPAPSLGRSLRDTLNEVITFNGQVQRDDGVVERIQRNAVRSADFLATSTAPGFLYRYSVESGAFERTATAQGPVFVEPPGTVGERHVDLGISYLYAPFSDLDGDSLEDALDDLRNARGGNAFATTTDEFSLTSHFLSFYSTYGITEHFDVNLLVPLVITSLDLRGRNTYIFEGSDIGNTFDAAETRVGVGDVLLRAKHRLPEWEGIASAGMLTLRVPTGDEDDFQGLGDVVLTPLLAASRIVWSHEAHANVGFDVNADDLERCRVRYALGVAFRVLDPLTLLLDVVGSSGVSDDSFTDDGFPAETGRSDVVDLAVGVKIAAWERIVANVGLLVPLTDDGLRAPVLPAGGVDVTF